MSRTNNTFPKYVKLKVDAANPPHDLWERGGRKCVKCGINWPNYSIFNPSPCCDATTGVVQNSAEMPWSEAVKRLLNARFERYYEKWNEDVTDEALLFDSSIEVAGIVIDERELQSGMAEIERLIGEPEKSSME